MEHVDSGFGQRGEQFLQSCRVVGDFRREVGAHGYLLDQFLWERTNLRTDGYGGSLTARTRFPAEVIAAVRGAVGPDYPIIFRFSQWKGTDYAKSHHHRCRICARYMAIACMHGTPQK